MNKHRIALFVGAICLMILGTLQVADGLVRKRAVRDAWLAEFEARYAQESLDDRYGDMYQESIVVLAQYGNLVMSYHASLGGAALVVGLFILAVLSDTRERSPGSAG